MEQGGQMQGQDFGAFLRREREHREIPLAEIARKTKLSPSCVQHIEAGRLEDLPPEVFVRGFIRSYTRALGISDVEPLQMFERRLATRRSEEAASLVPAAQTASVTELLPPESLLSGSSDGVGEDGSPQRRGIGIAVLVIILLLIATVTLSLYLRQPPQSGEGLSLAPTDAVAALLASLC